MFMRRLLYSAIGLAMALSLTHAFSPRANAVSPLPQPPSFTLQDLGRLPFIANGDALPGLSDTGKVCFWQDRGQAAQGAVWSQGQTRVLPGITRYRSSITRSVSAGGEVAGWAGTSANSVDSRSTTRACVWRGNVPVLLGTLGGRNSEAFGINSQNSVVGDAQRADGARHAFLAESASTQNSSLRDLGTLSGGTFSQAYAINSAGYIVGISNSALPYKHAVCWQGGKIHDLGLLPGGRTSSAQAINARDQIAGYADTPQGTHAFLYTQGKMRDLGTLGEDPSAAAALNDQGQVVGTSGFVPDVSHAFFWRNGVMFDLNKLIPPGSPWVLLRGCAINNHSQIVCVGHSKNDQIARIFLLTPVLAHAN